MNCCFPLPPFFHGSDLVIGVRGIIVTPMLNELNVANKSAIHLKCQCTHTYFRHNIQTMLIQSEQLQVDCKVGANITRHIRILRRVNGSTPLQALLNFLREAMLYHHVCRCCNKVFTKTCKLLSKAMLSEFEGRNFPDDVTSIAIQWKSILGMDGWFRNIQNRAWMLWVCWVSSHVFWFQCSIVFVQGSYGTVPLFVFSFCLVLSARAI